MRGDTGTVCFLVKDDEVLLGKLRHPDGTFFWNGFGGVVEPTETPTEGLIRELHEELGILVSEEDLIFKTKVTVNSMQLWVYVLSRWQGELIVQESSIEELRWFQKNDLPYADMHPGNDVWLPAILLK